MEEESSPPTIDDVNKLIVQASFNIVTAFNEKRSGARSPTPQDVYNIGRLMSKMTPRVDARVSSRGPVQKETQSLKAISIKTPSGNNGSNSSSMEFTSPSPPSSLSIISPTCVLLNHNLSCFMDVIIFVIMSIPDFVQMLFDGKKNFQAEKAPLFHFLADLILKLHTNHGPNIRLLDTKAFETACFQPRLAPHKNSLQKESPFERFFKGLQEDAQEFFQFLFSKLDDELSDNDTLNYPSRINEMFATEIKEEIICNGCRTPKTPTVESLTMQFITLANQKEMVDLKTLIEQSLTPTELMSGDNTVSCSTIECRNPDGTSKKQPMTKRTTITKAPSVLGLYIVRNEKGSRSQTSIDQKIPPCKILTPVKYYMEIALPEQQEGGSVQVTYELVSIVLTTEFESLKFGHFRGFFKFNGQWYRVDDFDSKGFHVEEQEVLSANTTVYLLFYIRKNDASSEKKNDQSGIAMNDDEHVHQSSPSSTIIPSTDYAGALSSSLASTAIPPPTAISNNSLVSTQFTAVSKTDDLDLDDL